MFVQIRFEMLENYRLKNLWLFLKSCIKLSLDFVSFYIPFLHSGGDRHILFQPFARFIIPLQVPYLFEILPKVRNRGAVDTSFFCFIYSLSFFENRSCFWYSYSDIFTIRDNMLIYNAFKRLAERAGLSYTPTNPTISTSYLVH